MQRHAEIVANRATASSFSDNSSFIGASVNKTIGLTFQKLNKAAAVVEEILEPAGKDIWLLFFSIGRYKIYALF